MEYQGVLKKMITSNDSIVQYYLDMNDDFLNMTLVTMALVSYR